MVFSFGRWSFKRGTNHYFSILPCFTLFIVFSPLELAFASCFFFKLIEILDKKGIWRFHHSSAPPPSSPRFGSFRSVTLTAESNLKKGIKLIHKNFRLFNDQ